MNKILFIFLTLICTQTFAACDDDGCYIDSKQGAKIILKTIQGNPNAKLKTYNWYGTRVKEYSLRSKDELLVCSNSTYEDGEVQLSCRVGSKKYFSGTRNEF